MGFFSKNIEQTLNKISNEIDSNESKQNLLLTFDNWTYHIRFSMLSKSDYELYKAEKRKIALGLSNDTAKANQYIEKGIVIAESGVINNPSIHSLTAKSFIGLTNKTLTTNMSMQLIDLEGTALSTKINSLAKYCGWGSNQLAMMPFFITIWFVGYAGDRDRTASKSYESIGEQQKEIEIFPYAKNKRSKTKLYYEVVPTKVSSDSVYNKTTWSFDFSTVDHGGLIGKNNLIMKGLGEVKVKKSNNLLVGFTDVLTKNVNELIISNTKNADEVYKGIPPVSICLYDTLSNQCIYKSDGSLNLTTTAYIDSKTNQVKLENKYSSNPEVANLKDSAYQVKTSNLVIPTNVKEKVFHLDKDATFLDAIDNFVHENIVSKDGELFGIRNIVERYPAESVDGLQNYYNVVHTFIEPIPGADVTKKVINNESTKNTQSNFLVYSEKLFQKKYEWMTGNNNNCVISYDTKYDNLWYLNVGLSAIESAKNNRYDASKNRNRTTVKEENKKEEIKAPKEKVQNLEGITTLNDFWDKVEENEISLEQLWLNGYCVKDEILVNNDILFTDPSDNDEDNIEKVKNKIGYSNLLSSANALECNLKIIGDPYWLDIGSLGPALQKHQFFNAMIILKLNTCYTLDKHDNYKADPLTQATIPYSITEITSNFANGSFTQNLKGCVPIPFLKSED